MIILQNLRKVFNRNTVYEKVAIDGISLLIQEGEFITVIGSNGAGKTTLLNLIAGTVFPDEGQILIDGLDVTSMAEHKRAKFLGRIFQDPLRGTASSMTIEENLSIAELRGQRRGLKRGVTKKMRERYADILRSLDLGLEHRLGDSVNLLSGGERQSLTLVMATLSVPKLLLLDEHTASLDPQTAMRVIELTNKVVRENSLSTIMVTHNMKMAIEYGTRMIMLHQGRIILDVSGDAKRALTIDEIVRKFGKDLKDETLLVSDVK